MAAPAVDVSRGGMNLWQCFLPTMRLQMKQAFVVYWLAPMSWQAGNLVTLGIEPSLWHGIWLHSVRDNVESVLKLINLLKSPTKLLQKII